MNAFTALLSSLTSRGPALVFGCAAVGLIGGMVGGMIHYSLQKPVFESYALIHPPRDTPEITWMESEAEAMTRRSQLEGAARKSGMEGSRRMSAAMCADLLEKSVRATIVMMGKDTLMTKTLTSRPDPDSNGYSVLRVAMQGDDAEECASVVAALISLREKAWITSERIRSSDNQLQDTRDSREAASEELQEKARSLRAELVAGLPALGYNDPNISDAKLASMVMPALFKPLQKEWTQAHEAWQRVSATPIPSPILMPWAEVLVKPKPAKHPIGPRWAPYGWPWIAVGTVAGLTAGLIFRQFKAWKEESVPVEELPTATAM